MSSLYTGSDYFNYKGSFSIVLLAIVDASANFIFVNVGCQGRISDGGVFSNTSIYDKIQRGELDLPRSRRLPGGTADLPFVFVADDAFPLQKHIIKPFSGYQMRGSMERVFNYRLSRASIVVENAFGILASVFRVLTRPILLQPDKATMVVLACVHLHNFRRRNASTQSIYSPPGTFDRFDSNTGDFIPGEWRTDSNEGAYFPLQSVPEAPSSLASDDRSQFGKFCLGPHGQIPSQQRYI